MYVADAILADHYADMACRAGSAVEETVRASLADSGHAALVAERRQP